jgi:predicted PurR-regulated permease PerM
MGKKYLIAIFLFTLICNILAQKDDFITIKTSKQKQTNNENETQNKSNNQISNSQQDNIISKITKTDTTQTLTNIDAFRNLKDKEDSSALLYSVIFFLSVIIIILVVVFVLFNMKKIKKFFNRNAEGKQYFPQHEESPSPNMDRPTAGKSYELQ